MPYKVFISHAESDRDLALKVAQEVERSGGEAILGPSSLRQGAKIPPKIVEALRQSDVVVGLASSNSSQSAWFNAEMGAAWRKSCLRHSDPFGRSGLGRLGAI